MPKRSASSERSAAKKQATAANMGVSISDHFLDKIRNQDQAHSFDLTIIDDTEKNQLTTSTKINGSAINRSLDVPVLAYLLSKFSFDKLTVVIISAADEYKDQDSDPTAYIGKVLQALASCPGSLQTVTQLCLTAPDELFFRNTTESLNRIIGACEALDYFECSVPLPYGQLDGFRDKSPNEVHIVCTGANLIAFCHFLKPNTLQELGGNIQTVTQPNFFLSLAQTGALSGLTRLTVEMPNCESPSELFNSLATLPLVLPNLSSAVIDLPYTPTLDQLNTVAKQWLAAAQGMDDRSLMYCGSAVNQNQIIYPSCKIAALSEAKLSYPMFELPLTSFELVFERGRNQFEVPAVMPELCTETDDMCFTCRTDPKMVLMEIHRYLKQAIAGRKDTVREWFVTPCSVQEVKQQLSKMFPETQFESLNGSYRVTNDGYVLYVPKRSCGDWCRSIL